MQWYAPVALYPGSRYPEFLSGTAYLMSRLTATTLYRASMQVNTTHSYLITTILRAYTGLIHQ